MSLGWVEIFEAKRTRDEIADRIVQVFCHQAGDGGLDSDEGENVLSALRGVSPRRWCSFTLLPELLLHRQNRFKCPEQTLCTFTLWSVYRCR